jgi:hypothetical protein
MSHFLLIKVMRRKTRRMDGNIILIINMATGFYAEIKPRLLVSEAHEGNLVQVFS